MAAYSSSRAPPVINAIARPSSFSQHNKKRVLSRYTKQPNFFGFVLRRLTGAREKQEQKRPPPPTHTPLFATKPPSTTTTMSTSGAPKKGTTGGSAQAEGCVAPPPEEGGPAVTTRVQEKGAPALKPGALNTGAYYAERDMGYGDERVAQETDEAAKDTEKTDPTFKPSGGSEETKAAE